MKAPDSVKVEGLFKRFGDFTAVDHISFKVSRGEIFGFLGSNGAGKTTTIRMLCGLLRPSGGQAWVEGREVSSQSEGIKRIVGYMSQKFSLYDELTVAENLRFFSGLYGVPHDRRKERIEEVLEGMGLTEQRHRMVRLLPGGWKQRLALGCAIVHQPQVLFLDEPTSGADPMARRTFWEHIHQLSDEGRTVFVTTHYMDEAEHCHRLALMHSGRIVALDTPEALRDSLPAGLMHLEPDDIPRTLQLLEDAPGVLEAAVFGGGLHLRLADPGRDVEQVRRLLEEHAVAVRTLEEIRPGIEDVFVSLIEAEEGRS